MDKELGMKYRKLILAPGGSRDSMELIKEFLGRDPNEEAFLEQNGFIWLFTYLLIYYIYYTKYMYL